MEQVYTPSKDYKVLVRCMTYNQSKYIEDALNGFVMQKTDFPFVCLVMDDASTDGEQEVIKAWMERECDMGKAENVEIEKSFITLLPHKTNSSCTFAFYFLKKNLYGTGEKTPLITSWREHCEYEAICEGDDWWIDSLKLQKQSDVIDSSSKIGVCYTKSKVYYQNTATFDNKIGGSDYLGFKSQLLREPIMTLTSMFRIDMYFKYMEEIVPETKGWLMGDTPMWLWFSHNAEIVFIKDITASYRVLEHSASHSSDYNEMKRYNKSLYDIRCFFVTKYCPDDNNIVLKIKDDYCRRNMSCALESKLFREYFSNLRLLSKYSIKDFIRPFYQLIVIPIKRYVQSI